MADLLNDEQDQKGVKILLQKYGLAIIAVVIVLVTVLWAQTAIRKTKRDLSEKNDALNTEVGKITAERDALASQLAQMKKEKEESERKACQGIWKEGSCVARTCSDLDGAQGTDAIYVAAKVTYLDEKGESQEEIDRCVPNGRQVIELFCKESSPGSGNFLPERVTLDCPNKKCSEGACQKKKNWK